MSADAWIIAALRSAVMPRGGAFDGVEVHALGAPVVRACLVTAALDAGEVDELVVGNALGAGGNPARLVALAAGLPERVAGLTIDRQCCGGLDALLVARAMIGSGAADVVLAGGVESYSRRPLRLRTSPDGAPPVPYDRPPFSPWPDRDPEMHAAADALARRLSISRREQDDWTVASHAKAVAARDRLAAEIAPIGDAGARHDAYARSMSARLCRRAPVLCGSVTRANAAVAADAAAFCVVVSRRVARRLGGRAVRIASGCTLGGPPELPGLAPLAAIERALASAGLRPADLPVSEIMEAYAVQAIACVHGAGLDPETVNRGGGALARGHPIGASGAILAVRAWHELAERPGAALAAIAAAGGLGTALVLAS